MKNYFLLPLLTLLLLANCSSVLSPEDVENKKPEFFPEVFFAGNTTSSGTEENSSGEPVALFHVRGFGQRLSDGSFSLAQTVTFDGKAPETREWRMRQLDAHHYTASLSDAAGAVEGKAYGNILHLHYAIKRPFGPYMDQWLYLQPDGVTVINEARVSFLGVTILRLSERITREGANKLNN